MDLTEESTLVLITEIKLIGIAMRSNHQPDWVTKEELNDKNSDKLWEIADELRNRYCPHANL